MTECATSLAGLAADILTTEDPAAKVDKTFAAAAGWRAGDLTVGHCRPPDRPARPARPVLCRPGQMPKRSTGPKGRLAFIHALAHIELNAIDLAWDIIARFTSDNLPNDFYDDWVNVAEEEARHFRDLSERLQAWHAAYGDFPAHDGLWEAATITAHDLKARLALIPMTLEARGIDTTPQTVDRFQKAEDGETAAILNQIYEDEIKHLAVGVRWFEFLCTGNNEQPAGEYSRLLETYFRGTLKGPFNVAARRKAGMGTDYLAPWL